MMATIVVRAGESVQQAVDAAKEGDTVVVKTGAVMDCPLVASKQREVFVSVFPETSRLLKEKSK